MARLVLSLDSTALYCLLGDRRQTESRLTEMNDKKPLRGGLGRGLSALMADVAPAAEVGSAAVAQRNFLAVELVEPNPNQPRRDFPAEALQELAESIRQKGIVQPLIVRPALVSGKFEIVAGERRWRAAQIAGLHEVPVLIRDYDD